MSPDIPDWESIDPTGEALSEPVGAALDSAHSVAGCVVVLVASDIDRQWGANTSLLIAREWASKGRSVLLADASLDDPVLHEIVDGGGSEGLSDVMLYGASVKQVARPVEGGILLCTAGTPVGDTEEVLAHPKWDMVIQGFQEAGALLLLHLSAGTPGAGTLLDRASRVILISESDGDTAAIVGAASDRLLTVVGPAVAEEVESPSEPATVVEEVESTGEAATVLEEMEPATEAFAVEDDGEEEATSEPELESAPTMEVEPEPAEVLEEEPEPEVEMVSENDGELEPDLESEPSPESESEPTDGELFSMDELPESTGNAAEQVDESGAFSFDSMSGSQYDADDDTQAEASMDEPAAPVEQTPSPGGEAEEEAEPSSEADEATPSVPEEAAPATTEAVEDSGMVEGVTRSSLEMDEEAVAAAAEEAHLDMDGFETGAGFDLEDAPQDDDGGVAEEPAWGGEAEDEEAASDDFGFGGGGLEVEASPFAEEDAPVDEHEGEGVDVGEEAAGLAGAAGDEAFGDRGPPPAEPDALDAGDDGQPADTDGGSIAVDPAAEAMGGGPETASAEDEAPDVEIEFDDAPPAKMSGLEELERRRKRGARVRQLLVAAATALVVGGGGVGIAYFGFVNIPGITPPDRVRSGVPAPVELPGPTPVTPVISHVLAVDAWRSLETALSTVDALRERLPEYLFFITVTEVDGGDQYVLLAGPAFSAVEANALKEPLAEVLDRLDPATWTVQEARYSFFFGEYSDAADAAGRVQSLNATAIPAHALEVSYPDETTAMRVYGGAFVDEFQAAAMGRLLRSNDLDDVRLTERRGRLPE